MKFIKILLHHRAGDEKKVRSFIGKNMSQEMLNGLEHDDPKTIRRALKMFGIEYDTENKISVDLNIENKKTKK
jgi:hypothetical protein